MGRPLFEHQVCSRCHGTGNYSYNRTDGTVCYGCGGSTFQLTKRGRAAQTFYRNSCNLKANELKVGMVVNHTGVTFGGSVYKVWAKITKIEDSTMVTYKNGERKEIPTISVDLIWKTTEEKARYFLDTDVWVKPEGEEREEKIQAALTFQSTLTKAGTIKKR